MPCPHPRVDAVSQAKITGSGQPWAQGPGQVPTLWWSLQGSDVRVGPGTWLLSRGRIQTMACAKVQSWHPYGRQGVYPCPPA